MGVADHLRSTNAATSRSLSGMILDNFYANLDTISATLQTIGPLDVQVLDVQCIVFDELAAALDILAH